MNAEFVHLHTHSEYSMLDGMSKIEDLIRLCDKYKMPALALTEHGNMFSAVPFYKAVEEHNKTSEHKIKPIIGCEFYIAPGSLHDKDSQEFQREYHHILLICENEIGYKNICQLATISYLEGYHKKPRIDMEVLAKYNEGLILGTACLSSRLSRALLNDNEEVAKETLNDFIDIFGRDRIFVEVMYHGLSDEDKINPKIIELSKKYGLLTVATQDSHYTFPDDFDAHEVLLCIQTLNTLSNKNRMKFGSSLFYFRTPEEMYETFKDYPEFCRNSLKIAERCEFSVIKPQKLIPKFKPEDGSDSKTFLRKLVYDVLEKKFGKKPPERYKQQVEYELKVIEDLEFVDYFLVVWDLINFAKVNGIIVGPGRGSAAGSLVAYLLGITNIDPIKYNLLFERFLNPDRKSMPDIDSDFEDVRRSEIIKYAISKYGEGNVSQIATYNRLQARNVIRDVARVLGVSHQSIDPIAKMIPKGKVTLNQAIEMVPELRKAIQQDSTLQRVWNFACKLEGTIKTSGTHAAGIVISDKPIVEVVALYKEKNSEFPSTQAEKDCVEYLGLLKMDILGLKTLTVIKEALSLIKKHKRVDLDIENIPLDDKKTFELIQSGNTLGVFQLESAGMRNTAVRMKVQSFEELSALIALYRPGPMKFIDTFIENKFHPERITYWHPILEPIVKETYGIPIYQEQVMQIAQKCAGFTLPQADILRAGISKKKWKVIEEMKILFVEGCKKQGIDQNLALQIYENIQEFGNYGFNKSHSVAYAMLSYKTAYLKANYPEEFMCALLTSEIGNTDKTAEYIQETKRMGIKILPPDINKSGVGYTLEKGAIRFALAPIKNVGVGICEAIVNERKNNGPFKNFFEFCTRVGPKYLNRRVLESLIKAGVFDLLGISRKQALDLLEKALSEAQLIYKEKLSNQISLFSEKEEISYMSTRFTVENPNDEFPLLDKLSKEKEVLGLYISGHPLEPYKQLIDIWTAPKHIIEKCREGEELIIGGVVSAIKEHTTERGKMAFVKFESLKDAYEVTFFTDTYEKNKNLIYVGNVLFLITRASTRNNQRSLIAKEIINPNQLIKFSKALHIKIDSTTPVETIENLLNLIVKNLGKCGVYFHYVDNNCEREFVVQAH
ncbi:MAG: DNA polymerase III subunit alpha, partial [Candidatus Hydrogenedentes bacterium]|nr:DNA polymerase III subunit alpha [Candidatus Hydrogenedentota bacterium]